MFIFGSRSIRQWRSAFEANGQLFAFTVQEGRVVTTSCSLLRILGFGRDAVQGEPITSILPASTWDSIATKSERRHGRASHHLVSMRHADGSVVDAAVLLWHRAERKGKCHYVMGCTLREMDELERGNLREREEMLAYLSHEIRTPVSALTGLLELLRGTSLSAEQEPLVNALSDLAGKVHTLLNDMLDLSRVRAGRMLMHMEDFALYPLLLRLSETYAVLHPDVEVLLTYDETLPEVCHGDSHRIEQALTNALSNAFKFTPTGQVRLVASRVGGDGRLVRLSVEDTGMGMEGAMLARLFEPYVSHDAKGVVRGSGLGMHIAHLVAELHGGRAYAESELGVGTRVHFELPLLSEDPVAMAEAEPVAAVSSSSLRLKGAELFGTLRRGEGRRVLLVDDNAINMMVVRKFMQLWGYEHDEAFDGLQALERISQHRYALVLMDLRMPTMGGLEATERVRQGGKAWGEVPIIALTASTEGGIRAKMVRAGMDGFIFKPFVAEDLKAVIAHYLDSEAAVPEI